MYIICNTTVVEQQLEHVHLECGKVAGIQAEWQPGTVEEQLHRVMGSTES